MIPLPQWIVVLLAPRENGKTDKIPLDHASLQPCDAHDPRFWTTFEHALAIARPLGAQFTVGFVLTSGDPWFCVDIDSCATPAGWSPLAQRVAAALPGCMVEVSQSGRGLHLWGRYPNPPAHRKVVFVDGVKLECYTERRFIALGQSQHGAAAERCDAFPAFLAEFFPAAAPGAEIPNDGPRGDWRGPADDDELIRRARRSKTAGALFGTRASFEDLWTANADALARAYPPDTSSTEPYDRSSADAALAQHLAFWTGCDVARMERLMRRSALVREKWDTRDDYLVERTIMGACSRQVQVLQDKPLEAAPGPDLPAGPDALASTSSGDAPPAAPAVPAPAGAPQPTRVTGHTFVTVEEQRNLFRGCVYVLDQHRVLVPGGRLLKPDQFKAWFGGYTFQMDDQNAKVTRNAWEAFTESQVLRAPRADSTCFRPRLPYGEILNEAGRTRVNVYWPLQIDMRPGDTTPFDRHLRLLIPNDRDRAYLFYYMAACVQEKGYKFQWAPVIQGVEGNGKTFLSRCVAYACGYRYTHWPKADKLGAQFNGWLFGNVFYAVEDVHMGDRFDVWEQLKPMITGGDGLEIERKGVDQTSEEICGNFIFNSNHRAALRKTRNDRRIAPFFCAQQSVDDLARDGMTGDYMASLYDWAKAGGYAHVAHLLATVPIPDDMNPARGLQRAPRTSSTDEAIEASYTTVEQELVDCVEREELGFRGGWISSGAVDRLLHQLGKDRAVSLNHRRALLQSLGYDWHPALNGTRGRVNNPVMPDGAKVKLFVHLQRGDLLALRTPAEVAAAYSAAQGASTK